MAALGLGLMRLPLKSKDPTDIDFDLVCKMVDEFMAAGFNYFDTSYVYHNGASENAIKRCVSSRYPREKFILTSKLPTFSITKENQVEEIFAKQLDNCGVEYFNNFLLHNINDIRYENRVKSCRMFEHASQWKSQGKIKNLGISFHDNAEVLDKILTEHPEIDVVQIIINYVDWESEFIQAHKCYEVIRKHGKRLIAMEPVKGGMISQLPPAGEKLLKDVEPDKSISSWAIRFVGSLDGVDVVLSGMSNLDQIRDNIETMKNFKPLSKDEIDLVMKARSILFETGEMHTADFSKYREISPNGIPASAVLESYISTQLQSNPLFAAENNYYTLEKLKRKIPLEDTAFPGIDDPNISKAENFLNQDPFATYQS